MNIMPIVQPTNHKAYKDRNQIAFSANMHLAPDLIESLGLPRGNAYNYIDAFHNATADTPYATIALFSRKDTNTQAFHALTSGKFLHIKMPNYVVVIGNATKEQSQKLLSKARAAVGIGHDTKKYQMDLIAILDNAEQLLESHYETDLLERLLGRTKPQEAFKRGFLRGCKTIPTPSGKNDTTVIGTEIELRPLPFEL